MLKRHFPHRHTQHEIFTRLDRCLISHARSKATSGAIGPWKRPPPPFPPPHYKTFRNNNKNKNYVPITPISMAVFAFKTASRAVFRRAHFPTRPQPHLAKRHNSNPATRPKAEDDPANGTAIPVPATVANVPLWQRLGPLSRGFQAYGRSQRRRPYATQFCSSLVIYFLGDLAAQNINGEEYDPKRMLRALVISAGSSIPSYKWCRYLAQSLMNSC
jgi:hypothetical protein